MHATKRAPILTCTSIRLSHSWGLLSSAGPQYFTHLCINIVHHAHRNDHHLRKHKLLSWNPVKRVPHPLQTRYVYQWPFRICKYRSWPFQTLTTRRRYSAPPKVGLGCPHKHKWGRSAGGCYEKKEHGIFRTPNRNRQETHTKNAKSITLCC